MLLSEHVAALVIATLGTFGCQPSIGDRCVLSTDCSATNQRRCDTSTGMTNGYCTVDCTGNHCPSGSACVATNAALLGCAYDDRHAPSRTSEEVCLASCSQDTDCRVDEGYACIVPSTYGIVVLDTDQTQKVCLPSTTYVVSTVNGSPVCNTSGPVVSEYDAGAGYAGDAALD